MQERTLVVKLCLFIYTFATLFFDHMNWTEQQFWEIWVRRSKRSVHSRTWMPPASESESTSALVHPSAPTNWHTAWKSPAAMDRVWKGLNPVYCECFTCKHVVNWRPEEEKSDAVSQGQYLDCGESTGSRINGKMLEHSVKLLNTRGLWNKGSSSYIKWHSKGERTSPGTNPLKYQHKVRHQLRGEISSRPKEPGCYMMKFCRKNYKTYR